jgi:hypothetical protein
MSLDRLMNRQRQKNPNKISLKTIYLITQILKQLKIMLKDKKTYVVAAVAVISAIASYLTGDLALNDGLQVILTAILGATLRNGIKSEVGKVK